MQNQKLQIRDMVFAYPVDCFSLSQDQGHISNLCQV